MPNVDSFESKNFEYQFKLLKLLVNLNQKSFSSIIQILITI